MTQNTSSPKQSYNIMALRGAKIDDMEVVEANQLPPNVAYTPEINTIMVQKMYDENIEAGVPKDEAMELRTHSEKTIKHLLAKKGLLK